MRGAMITGRITSADMSDNQRGWRPEDVHDGRPTHTWHGTGEHLLVDAVSRIPEFDPATRAHLWSWALLFRMHPGVEVPMLDNENLLLITGPACFYCEQLYIDAGDTPRCPGMA